MASLLELGRAFARQAKADLDTWDFLQGRKEVPACHKLLFLQMACEKLVKAHLAQAGQDIKPVHTYTAKHLETILRHRLVGRSVPNGRAILRHAKHLSQEIELLAPAVKRGGQRPDNCEYPWEDSMGTIHTPLEWSFVPSGLLLAPAGRTVLKLLRESIESLV
jgi:hypothetical protein